MKKRNDREDPNEKPEGEGNPENEESGKPDAAAGEGSSQEDDPSEMVYGTCRYCKQMKLAYPVGVFSQESVDEQATEGCDCSGARAAREARKRYEGAVDYLDQLVDALQARSVIMDGDEIAVVAADALKCALDSVWNDVFDSVTVKVNGNQIMISKPKEKVKIRKSRTLTADEEF